MRECLEMIIVKNEISNEKCFCPACLINENFKPLFLLLS